MDLAVNQPQSHVRIDGRAKVMGAARYAADFPVERLAHVAAITSTIARGRIVGFDFGTGSLGDVRRMPGVLRVFTYSDFASAIQSVPHLMAGGYANSSALPMGSAEVHYAGQIVALVTGESAEIAQEAALKIKVQYEAEQPAAALGHPGAQGRTLRSVRPIYKDPKLGDAKAALETAAVKVEQTYRTPIQHHNPIELFGTTCVWDGDRLTVYEATRYVKAVQYGLAMQLGMDPERVRVLCPFMGGHFGSRLALSQYTAPVAIAARILGRPLRYVASRSQGFTVANHRPDTEHQIRIGATKDGQFVALDHNAEFTTSRFDNFGMEGTDVTGSLYGWRNVETQETLVSVDRNTPGPMRAPPEVPYLFALESAVDELAEKLGMDPIELRRRNEIATDPITGKPFTPRKLMECFETGSKSFGWSSRNPKPCSMRDGEWLVGYGCATSVRPVKRAAAMMQVTLTSDGHATVETSHHEIGNGISTVLAMEAAAQLGIDTEAVTVRLGDSSLPAAGISGGSSTTTSLVPVLRIGCRQILNRMKQAAPAFTSALGVYDPKALRLRNGMLTTPHGAAVPVAELFQQLGTDTIEVVAEFSPNGSQEAIDKLREGHLILGSPENSLTWAFGAQFAEVRVHSLTGEICVPRMTGAFYAGRILNRLTALSQLRGGMIWGLGSALLEATVLDPGSCRYINNDLAEYLVATAADTALVDAIILDDDGGHADLMGLGELGIIGVNAAIANAIFHATGERIRTLPIRVEDVMPI